jgi:glycosyltransferase involved in cell wall biosynthesis
MNNPEVSFIIPLYNESEVFSELINEINKLLTRVEKACEVILVDDGSMDETALKIKEIATQDSKFQGIILSRNFGQQNAISAGLDFARGNYIMFLDADLQDPPELYFEFMKKIDEGYDVVYGIRKNRKENFVKRICYDLFYKLLNRISNFPIPKDTGDFALITRPVADAMNMHREDSRFLRGVRSWVGFKQCGIEYERQERKAGSPKYTFRKLLKLAADGIFNFTTLPITLLFTIGSISIISSLIYFIITLIRKYLYEEVPKGFTALLFVIIFFGGLQLLFIGLIGEYIQRIFFQVKNRPLYVINKKIIDGHEQNK